MINIDSRIFFLIQNYIYQVNKHIMRSNSFYKVCFRSPKPSQTSLLSLLWSFFSFFEVFFWPFSSHTIYSAIISPVLQGGLAPQLWDQKELQIQLWHNDSIPQGLSFAPKMTKIFNKVPNISPFQGCVTTGHIYDKNGPTEPFFDHKTHIN